jgi:hypothetical protein
MNPNRSLSNFQGAVYQYTYNAKKASGVCLQNVTDYSPFGVMLDGRTMQGEGYRYGFGNHEKIDEVFSFGNLVDMSDRWLDLRLGRTLKTDRKASKYPDLSPFSFAANNPILLVDPNGETFRIYYELKNAETGKTALTYVDFNGTKGIFENGTEYTTGVNQFVDDVISSYDYIVEKGADVGGVLQNLATRCEITNVIFTKVIDGTEYDVRTETIIYNSLSGLNIKNNDNTGIQSSALGFFHEAVHRFIELEYTEEQKKELQIISKENASKEEWEVMDKYETPAVKILQDKGEKETYRKSYSWDSSEIWTSSPTSKKSVKKKDVKDTLNNRNITIE